jgi:hypothetical protein
MLSRCRHLVAPALLSRDHMNCSRDTVSRGLSSIVWALLVASTGAAATNTVLQSTHTVLLSTNTVVRSTNTVVPAGPEKIKQLERRANDRDMLALKIKRLELELEQVRGEAGGAPSFVVRSASSGGRLQDMERKARGYDAIAQVVGQKDVEIAALRKELEAAKAVGKPSWTELLSYRDQLSEMTNAVVELSRECTGLRATVEQLLLGNFEYYEVNAGDTLESIATKPLVYGDATKAKWLRQANYGRVKDPDKLMEGEMLVVPRFPEQGHFSF